MSWLAFGGPFPCLNYGKSSQSVLFHLAWDSESPLHPISNLFVPKQSPSPCFPRSAHLISLCLINLKTFSMSGQGPVISLLRLLGCWKSLGQCRKLIGNNWKLTEELKGACGISYSDCDPSPLSLVSKIWGRIRLKQWEPYVVTSVAIGLSFQKTGEKHRKKYGGGVSEKEESISGLDWTVSRLEGGVVC